MRNLRCFVLIQLMLTLFLPNVVKAQDAAVCAHVKIRLTQDITLTRTAFKATLEVANSMQNVRLDNVTVTLDVRDAANSPANGNFGISAPVLSGLSDVTGTGSIDPGKTGSAIWTMLPGRAAAPMTDTIYYVGGTLSYKQDGILVTIPLFPAQITVRPDPLLTFHYFLQYNVYSDDPFTPTVEPSDPFALGLIIRNKGYGTARNLTIATSQPEVVSNDKGLLIDFKLIGSQVNKDPVSPSLLVNMGDIAPQTTSTARWLLTSSLLGRFISFTGQYKHITDLGSPVVTSLIDGVNTQFMEHSVKLEGVDEDGRPDFLAYDGTPGIDAAPTLVFDSNDDLSAPVTPVLNSVVDAPITLSHLRATLTLGTVPAGYAYLRFLDPSNGAYTLLRVIRSDGKDVTLDNSNHVGNVWATDRVAQGPGQSPLKINRLHIFDKNPTATYTLVFGQNAPVITTAGGAKQYADGIQVSLAGIVTARFADGMYVEATDRASGIKVTPGNVNEGTAVGLVGILQTGTNGERSLQAVSVSATGQGVIQPLGLAPSSLYSGEFFYDAATGAGQRGMKNGYGLNAVGTLVRTIGRVGGALADGFVLLDAYGRAIHVALPAGVATPQAGTYVGLTGVVSCEQISGELYPVLRPRRAADLVPDLASSVGVGFTSPAGILAPGYNLFALAGFPIYPAPPSVLSNFDPMGNGSGLDGRLDRYNVTTQAEVPYNALSPALFGEMTVGEGYRLRVDPGDPTTIQYNGFRADFADWRIGIQELGATRIGNPLPYAFDFSELLVSDGIKTVPIRDAYKTVFPAWLNQFYTYSPGTTQPIRTVGLPEDNPYTTRIQPWTGYYVTAGGRNVALIFPTQSHAVIPTLTLVNPQSVAAAGNGFTLSLTGTNFTSSSIVLWAGQQHPTTYVSPTQLTALISAADIANSGSASVAVFNPALGGGLSNSIFVAIGIPQLAVTGIQSIVRDAAGITIVALVTNIGTGPASNIRFTSLKLGTANPLSNGILPDLIPGQITTVQFIFPNNAGAAGANVFLRVNGTYAGGSFTTSRRVLLP